MWSQFWRRKSVIFRSRKFPSNTHHNGLKIFQKVLLPQGPQAPVAPCWVASLYFKGLWGHLDQALYISFPMGKFN